MGKDNSLFKIEKDFWKTFIYTLDLIEKYDTTQYYNLWINRTDKIAWSMYKEGFADMDGNISFSKDKLAEFLLIYKEFFKDNFINILAEEILKIKKPENETTFYDPYLCNGLFVQTMDSDGIPL